MDAGRAATPEEIVTAFRAVKAMRPKMRATEYAMRPTEQCRIKTGHETRNEWRKALYQYASVIDSPRRS